MRNPRSILITGASSGIGQALAEHYAAPGMRLVLGGRDADRLETVGATCLARGAQVEVAQVDVTDAAAMAAWIRSADGAGPLDLVIANAGISGGTFGGGESDRQTRAIVAANVDGVLNTVLPAIPLMTQRRRGQIALMASLAGFRGMPGAPTYCASKAFVRSWGEGLRPDLAAHGVEVNVICPGFVVSRMTAANRFKMPMLMSAEKAAAIVVRGLERNRARIAFPWAMYWGALLGAALPPALTDLAVARLPKKG